MKKNIATSVIVTVFALVVFAATSFGQARAGIVADIPFDFQVGKRTMKAGKYEFEPANPQSNPWLLVVRTVGDTGQQSAFIVPTTRSRPVAADEEVVVRFNRYGSLNYLSSITAPSNGVVLKLLRNATEKRLAKTQRPEEARVVILPATNSSR